MASSLFSCISNLAENTIGRWGSQKANELAKDTLDAHDKNARASIDFGVKHSSTDDWLKVSSEDKTAPKLLENNYQVPVAGDFGISRYVEPPLIPFWKAC